MFTVKRLAILSLCIVAVAGFLIWQRLTINRTAAELVRVNEQLTIANHRAAGLRDQLQAVIDDADANDNAQAGLRNDLADAETLLASRQKTIERLKHENQQLKDWADGPLPADVIRLRQRPAVTGAAEYRAWLSETNGLSPAGDQPTNERTNAE